MSKIISVSQKMSINKIKLPLVIGFFDGVHIGHNKLLRNKKFNLLTFKNIPSKNNEFLFSEIDRIHIYEQLKPENIFILDLSKNNLTSQDFIKLLENKIQPSQIIVGNNFKFGKDRKGDIKLLKKYFKVNNVNILKNISTSNIKNLIKNSKIDLAQKQLISKFSITNKVVHGKGYGHKLGFPTANIYTNDKVIKIKPGVYAGFTKINNKTLPSAIFVCNSNPQLVESHLFKFNKNIYGKTIIVTPTKFINNLQKTNSEKALKQVITNNVRKIKSFLKI